MTNENYENYETLADQLRIGRLDNLVCTGCGVLVVDKTAHDRLHSVISSWALGIPKTLASAAHHDDECERAYVSGVFHVRQADRANYGHAEHRCVLKKPNRPWQETMHLCGCNFAWSVDETTGKTRRLTWDKNHQYLSQEPEPEESQPDRYEIAWKLWRWTEESDTPSRSSLRAQLSSGNWLKLGDGQLTKYERDDRDLYLARADQVVDMVGKRRYARFLNDGYFKCLEPECKGVQPDFENSDQAFIHARQKHNVNAIFFETDQNEENKS